MATNSRLHGIDYCYSIALVGTFLYIYALSFEEKMIGFLSHYKYSFFLDFFPAFFLFLNGFTASLSLRNTKVSTRKILSFFRRRGVILVLLGLPFMAIWPMNIIIISGLGYLLSGYSARWNNNLLLLLNLFFIVGSMTLLYIGVPASIKFQSFSFNRGLYSIIGTLFFNSYFSFLPWITFFITGLLFGREDIRPKGFLPPSSLFALVLALAAIPLEKYAHLYDADFNIYARIEPSFLNQKLNVLSFVFLAIASSIILLNLINYIFRRGWSGWLDNYTQGFASFKYSAIFFHMLLGFLALKISNVHFLDTPSVKVTVVVLLLILNASILILWKRKFNKVGPVESLIKRFSSTNK